MRLPAALFITTIFLLVGIVVAQFALTKIQSQAIAIGCNPQTTLGEVDVLDTVAIWQNHPVESINALASSMTPEEINVLGANSESKWIEVDLSDQKLTAHQGDGIFLESKISSGLTFKTPPGEYEIWYKIRSTKMSGGVKGTRSYYYLPNVPYAMFFNGDIEIHGTYWHNNFGTPMSHGCVNSPTPIAEKLFYWVNPQLPEGKLAVRSSEQNPGTKVIVHD